MTKSKMQSNADTTIPYGLLIHGIVMKRSRRYINTKNGETEIVTYIIEGADKKKWYVDHYSPDNYYSVLDTVTIPVYIKPYQKKTGALSYTINVQRDFEYSNIGEDF